MAKVTIVENGRDGRVEYADGLRAITGYWEFGAGDVVTIVSMGSTEEWQRAHAWGLEQRQTILRFVADEVIRQRAPSCTAEIDMNGGTILLRRGSNPHAAAQASASANQAKAVAFVTKYRDLRSMLAVALLVIALIVGALVWLGQKALTVTPVSGVPLNDSVRFDAADPARAGIATLIQMTDPHSRDISGRGGNETTSLSILVTPLDGTSPRLIPVVRKLSGHGYQLARIMGSDGRTVWFDAMGLSGVRLDDFTLVTPENLGDANPDLDPTWWDDPRGMDVVAGKLQIMRIDRTAAVEIDPDTWKATPIPPKPSNARFIRREPADHLAAVRPGETELLEAAYLRGDSKSGPLRLSGPDSTLMIHTSAPGGAGTLVVSRRDDQGKLLWSTDTGLHRFSLKQILPGQDVLAFVGSRPPIPDKLSEPLIALVDAKTGKLTSHSLWRYPR